ncbi:hypothetical protein AX14_014180 [Amanita brunnescens Koide BX004]|nr:hypothetical protein AX14_014180 [Amanita brunnescens Koide BX004]
MPTKKSHSQPIAKVVNNGTENEGTEDHLHAYAHDAVSDEHTCKKGKSRTQKAVESTVDETVTTGAQVSEILDDLLSHFPGPRQAKVTALDNAIWKQLAPAAGGSCKRKAETMGAPSETAVQQEKKVKTGESRVFV